MAPQTSPDADGAYRRYLDAVGLYGLAVSDVAGLHATDWYALSILAMAGSLTPGELAERTNLTTGATTRLIDRLEKGGHVRRVQHPTDRRSVLVKPTNKLNIDTLVGPARSHIGNVLDRYNAEEQAILFDYFTHAAPAFHQAAAEIRRTRDTRNTRGS
ncbi:MarR family transcriptional regulator [Actinosynnema sp. ALI-1.44]|uniref:MarR family transcriptional regulator n=1 Tax=Actinosynnema sp. ALI-1.44 TaxID=1933779 RepID=UPI00097BEB64|nr:MarR family transcriptional regulator [Actinosynnema sp. ALI-1.44]ONI88243.1 MarR family transcriptional regulator [Actinosynnema sp. ALI-1.44]